MTFNDFSLQQVTIDNLLSVYNISKPNEVQIKAYKTISDGRDMIISSPTGSGKTLAYLLPLVSSVDITQKTVQAVIFLQTFLYLCHQR